MSVVVSEERYAVDGKTGCWLWIGAKTPDGYGTMRVDGKVDYVHRVMCAALHGPIPPGHQVDHLCRDPSCVNPLHLEIVTPQENTHRGRRSKLTRSDAETIRRRVASGEAPQVVADAFGVSKSAVAFATRWRQRGLSVDELQILLGHASIATTADIYTHTNVEDVARHMALIEAGEG